MVREADSGEDWEGWAVEREEATEELGGDWEVG